MKKKIHVLQYSKNVSASWWCCHYVNYIFCTVQCSCLCMLWCCLYRYPSILFYIYCQWNISLRISTRQHWFIWNTRYLNTLNTGRHKKFSFTGRSLKCSIRYFTTESILLDSNLKQSSPVLQTNWPFKALWWT